MTIRSIVRKWGNSLGIIIPKEVATSEGIHEDDEVEVLIVRSPEIRDLFGKIRLGVPTQKIKDELRREWTD